MRSRISPYGMVLPILIASLAGLVAYPGCAIRTVCCDCHLQQIVIALQNYHNDFGTYPPTWVTDKAGRRLHSWRVLLLPYLGYEDLYRQYKFDEPWDGPNNRQLVDRMPGVYRCPDASSHEGVTNYFAIVGPHTMWRDDGIGIAHRDVVDPEGMTIMVCESKDRSTLWMQPDDLDSESVQGINVDGARGISSEHPDGANVGMAGGPVFFLRNDIDIELLRGLITRDGREQIRMSDFVSGVIGGTGNAKKGDH
jgi:Protein of unknown function (DUF1559)